MRYKLKPQIRCALALLILCLGTAAWAGKIVYPWNATTAIVKSGETFEVWFEADAGQEVKSAVLRGPYNQVVIPTVGAASGSWVYDATSGNTYNTRVSIQVPAHTPADRYDLYLVTSAGDEVSRRSVKVVRAFEPEYTIMHFSDTHMCHGGKLVNGHPKRLLKISALAEIGNLMGADLVFITGDVIDNTLLPPKERTEFFYAGAPNVGIKGIYGFDGATFSMPGNHDFLEGEQPNTGRYAEKAIFWNEFHGLQTYQFTYGKGRFMVTNTGWHGFDWAAQRDRHLTWLDEVGHGNFRAAAYHKSSMGNMGVFANDADLHLSMIGHNHHLAPNNPYELGGRPIQYYANAVREHFNFNLYQVRKDGTYQALNNACVMENPDDPPAQWQPKFTLLFQKSNTGQATTNTATLTNRYEVDFPRARVRFVMPLGKRYAVTGGEVEQAFDGDAFHIVDVCVPLTANGKANVSIAPNL